MILHVTLRPVRVGDEQFLADVYASTRSGELAMTDWTEEQKKSFCRMQFEAQTAHYHQHYPTAEYHVVEVDGCAAGRLYVDRWVGEIRIMDITILPEHRGKGVGRSLLEDLKTEAAGSGKILSIHVERMNPALRLYDRLGFRMAEDKGVYLLMEWRPGGDLT